jgi:hypothetical protein
MPARPRLAPRTLLERHTTRPRTSRRLPRTLSMPTRPVSTFTLGVLDLVVDGVGLMAFRFALAGALGCAITHGALTPVDVVKTRIQLEPEVYNRVGAVAAQIWYHAKSFRVWSVDSVRLSPTRVPVLSSPVSDLPFSVTRSRVP